MKALDSYTENEACRLIGRTVVDLCGDEAGSLRRIWLEPSTYHVEFAGVRSGGLFPRNRVVPARDVRFDEEKELIQLEHPRAFINQAPFSNPKAELAGIEKEEIDAYYGYFVPLRRTSEADIARFLPLYRTAPLSSSFRFLASFPAIPPEVCRER
jgi:PRC-barrel domain